VAAVIAAVIAGFVVVTRPDDGRGDARVATRPQHGRDDRGEPVTATLRLDSSVVHRGQDVLGTVTFRNRSDRTIDVRDGYGCPKRWAVVAGAQHPDGPPEFLDCTGRGRALTFPPGTTTRRVQIPTSAACVEGQPCGPSAREGRTKIWLLADAPEVRVPAPVELRVVGPPTPRFCRASDLVITNPTPTGARNRYRLVVRNPARTCELLGAAIVTPVVDQVGPDLPARRPAPIRLRRGDAATFAVTLARPGICQLGALAVQLPNGGGTLPIPGPLPFGPAPGAGCSSAVASGPSNFAPTR
jgi:hypothetical protein